MLCRGIKIVYFSFKCYTYERSCTYTCLATLTSPQETKSTLNSVFLFIVDKWAYCEVSLSIFY